MDHGCTWSNFEITRLGFFDCGISLSLGPTEATRKQLLNKLCDAMRQKTGWTWEISDVSEMSEGENFSEELRRYGMPIRARVPPQQVNPGDWLPERDSILAREQELRVYLYENGIGLLSVTTCFSASDPATLAIIGSYINIFKNWLSPAYYPVLLWKAIDAFRGIISTSEWRSVEISELRRIDHFTTATAQTPTYLVYVVCILRDAAEQQAPLDYLASWVSDQFASEQPIAIRKLGRGFYSLISWDVAVVLTQGDEASRIGSDVVRILEIIHYFWFLVYMTDSLLNRRIRELEVAREEKPIEGGIRQLRAFRIHIWRTMDNFRVAKLSLLPLHMVIFEITRTEWKIDQMEASILEKLNFLDTVYVQLRDELLENRQTTLNWIALAFTIITLASAVATIITTYDYDNTQFTRDVRGTALLISLACAALLSWLISFMVGLRRSRTG